MKLSKNHLISLAAASGLCVLSGFWVIGTYMGYDNQRNQVESNWEAVEKAYQPRFDLIPALADNAKPLYFAEREVFDFLATSRQTYALAGQPRYKAVAGTQLEDSLNLLDATIQSYPALTESASTSAVRRQLEKTREPVVPLVETYNQSVDQYNQRLGAFPARVIAKLFMFESAEKFEL